jgi:Na+-transporting methylmalonyl-CoA/oxaloacetate decarboxylase beta subunit
MEVSQEVEDVGADLSFRVAQLYHWLSNELGQDTVAFLINHALELVGELSLYNMLLADKCRREDSVTVAKSVLSALVRAVAVALSEDPEPDQVQEADTLIIRAQGVIFHKARQCLGLE